MWGLKSKTIAARSLALVLACSPLLFAGENKVPRPPAQTQPQRSQQPQTPQHHAGQWLRRYKDLPPDQQKRALDSDPQFRSLPEQRQQKLRDRLQRFNGLPPQQQQRILNRMETWEHLTPQQKSEARQVYSQIRQLPPPAGMPCRTRSTPCGPCPRMRVSARSNRAASASIRRRNASC